MTDWEPGDRVPGVHELIYRRELFQIVDDATCHPNGCQCYLLGSHTQPNPAAEVPWPWLKERR